MVSPPGESGKVFLGDARSMFWSLVGFGQPGEGHLWGVKVGGVSNPLSESVLSQVSSPRVTAFH